jgi:hypothetical protein
MNNITQQLVPEQLIERTLAFLRDMSMLDKLIEANGYQVAYLLNNEHQSN